MQHTKWWEEYNLSYSMQVRGRILTYTWNQTALIVIRALSYVRTCSNDKGNNVEIPLVFGRPRKLIWQKLMTWAKQVQLGKYIGREICDHHHLWFMTRHAYNKDCTYTYMTVTVCFDATLPWVYGHVYIRSSSHACHPSPVCGRCNGNEMEVYTLQYCCRAF